MTHYITRNCDNTTCNKIYYAEARYLNRGQGLYYSQSCASIARIAKMPVKEPNVTCYYCGKGKYVPPAKIKKSRNSIFFCNRECMIKAQQEGLLKTGPDSIIDVPRKRKLSETDPYCFNCNKTRSRRKDKLCEQCFKELNKINEWLNGNNDIATKPTNDSKPFVKEYLIKTRGDKCEKCGETGYNKKMVIALFNLIIKMVILLTI